MAQLAECLHVRFPELDSETIGGVLVGLYQRFERTRVRNFLPILIEAADHFAVAPRPRQPSSS